MHAATILSLIAIAVFLLVFRGMTFANNAEDQALKGWMLGTIELDSQDVHFSIGSKKDFSLVSLQDLREIKPILFEQNFIPVAERTYGAHHDGNQFCKNHAAGRLIVQNSVERDQYLVVSYRYGPTLFGCKPEIHRLIKSQFIGNQNA